MLVFVPGLPQLMTMSPDDGDYFSNQPGRRHRQPLQSSLDPSLNILCSQDVPGC
jgi:hypothetical protein